MYETLVVTGRQKEARSSTDESLVTPDVSVEVHTQTGRPPKEPYTPFTGNRALVPSPGPRFRWTIFGTGRSLATIPPSIGVMGIDGDAGSHTVGWNQRSGHFTLVIWMENLNNLLTLFYNIEFTGGVLSRIS